MGGGVERGTRCVLPFLREHLSAILMGRGYGGGDVVEHDKVYLDRSLGASGGVDNCVNRFLRLLI